MTDHTPATPETTKLGYVYDGASELLTLNLDNGTASAVVTESRLTHPWGAALAGQILRSTSQPVIRRPAPRTPSGPSPIRQARCKPLAFQSIRDPCDQPSPQRPEVCSETFDIQDEHA
ncbi:MAG: hypothetical protein R3C02_18820 [Planctomycetaceae bacterium]